MSFVKNLLIIVMCFSHLLVNAQIPFEKKGKWGIKNEKGKTLVKPKYESIKSVDLIENRFIVQGKAKRPFEDVKLCYGVIDSNGKQVIPITADSIEVTKRGFVAFISEGKSIDGKRWHLTYKTHVYDWNGNIRDSIPGIVVKRLPGGFFVSSDIRGIMSNKANGKNSYEDVPGILYNKNFTKIDDVERLENIREDAILTYKRSRGESEYTYWDNLTLTPILNFNHYDFLKKNKNIIIISDKDSGYGSEYSYGYINFKDKTYKAPLFRSRQLPDGSYVFYKDNEENECFIINSDGSFSEAVSFIYRDKFDDEKKLFFKKNEAGLMIIDDLEVNDVVPTRSLRGLLSVQKDGKWGLYNYDEKEFVVPFVLAGPVSVMNKKYIVTLIGDDWNTIRLCDIEGNKIFDVSSENLIDLENSNPDIIRTYKEDGLKITGIYSLKNNNWLFEPGKYGDIYTIEGDRFAVEVSPNKYNYVTSDGVVLSTLNNVEKSYHAFQNFTDFIKVTFTSGKIGLLNPKTGKWIIPGEYEKDIAFGGGSGSDRRIAVQQNSPQGELVSVYTIGGRKVASQFFPYNLYKRNIAIYNFGQKYLYH